MLTWYIPPYVNLSYKKGLKVTISFPFWEKREEAIVHLLFHYKVTKKIYEDHCLFD